MPAPAHEHVSEQDKVAREVHQDPLPDGPHALYRTSLDRGIGVNPGELREY